MNDQNIIPIDSTAREGWLYLYTSALERGDFDTVAEVWHAAEKDAELEHLLLEVEEALQSELAVNVQTSEETQIRVLLQKHMPTSIFSNSEVSDLPPVGVRDVISRMRTDPTLSVQVGLEATKMMQLLPQIDVPVPDNLSQQGVRKFLEKLNLSVSTRFQKIFRDTAIFLLMGRKQGMAHLAATRHQHRPSSPTSSHEEKLS